MVVMMAALFGTIILLPIYLQNVLGLEPLQTGLLLLPGGLIMGLLGPDRRAALRPVRSHAAARARAASWSAVVLWSLTWSPSTPRRG